MPGANWPWKQGGATLLVAGDDPVLLPKACKNAVEVAR